MSSIEYINSVVLTSAQSSVTFSDIPQSYQDLIIIISGRTVGNEYNPSIRFNSDDSASYSRTKLYGTGSSALSNRTSNTTYLNMGAAGDTTNKYFSCQLNIFSYSNQLINKSVLLNHSCPELSDVSEVGLWRSTNNISSILLDASFASGTGWQSGTTFTLWGVK